MATLRSLEWGGRRSSSTSWAGTRRSSPPAPDRVTRTRPLAAASSVAAGPGPAPRTSSAEAAPPVEEAGQGSLPPVQQEGPDPSLGKGAPGGPLADPVAFAAHIRARVLEVTRLHCSVGIGDNKLRAKIATEFGKPRGSYVLTAENWFEVMGDRPTTALWGIGSKTAKKLAALGIDTVDPAGAVGRAGAGGGARADDGAVVPPHRPRGQRQRGDGGAVGAAGARAGDDVPGGPRGLGPDRRGGADPDPAGGRRHRQGGPAGGAGGAQAALPARSSRSAAASPSPSRATTRRCWRTRR